MLELPRLEHRKSEALNTAWASFCQEDRCDLVVCLDADTILPENAVEDWIAEFDADPLLAGSSSKFTMMTEREQQRLGWVDHDPRDGVFGELLTRIQRAEFAKWCDTALRRRWTSVLAGTGCMIRNSALVKVADRDDRVGPWTYGSATEDFELTYRLREAGFRCQVSPTVRAYTDSMRSLPALWGQRRKWQTGTVSDLMTFGINRLTIVDWWQQLAGMAAALVRISWVLFTLFALITGTLFVHPLWLAAPLLFILSDVRQSLIIPHRDRWDIAVAASLIPQELFAWMRAGWFVVSWGEVLRDRLFGRQQQDHWAAQYTAEGAR
jgi:cellulose synthase/poly-beta-1,6-N-acetylglucosamine synthase-like glycosyltransferase